MITPCKGCQDRTSVCHANCERYREFYKARQEYLKKRFNEGEASVPSYMKAKLHDRWIRNFRRNK